jgi:uncharacterized protein YbaP (TraB family)
MINVRSDETNNILKDLATRIMENKGLMQQLIIDYFPGGVTLTTTFTVAGCKEFAKIEEALLENRNREMMRRTQEEINYMFNLKIGGSE